MKFQEIKQNVLFCGLNDPERVVFDELIPLEHGTSYNSYLIKGSEKIALIDTIMCGYSIPTSISDANDLLNKKVYTVWLFVVLPFIVITPLVVLGGLFGFTFIANLISMLIIFMYYPVLAFTMYFNFSNINRYDNIKKYYY